MKTYIISHPFAKECKNLVELLSDPKTGGPITSFSTFISRVGRFAKKLESLPVNQDNPYYIISGIRKGDGKILKDKHSGNLYRGNAFEMLSEVIFRSFPCDERLGIDGYSYIPVAQSVLSEEMTDVGVDGISKGSNGKTATVQMKFRPYNYLLKGDRDHLYNFTGASFSRYGVDPDDTNNMLIITSGDQVFYKDMITMWDSRVRFISMSKSWGCVKGAVKPCSFFSLKTMIDNNIIFWGNFLNSVKESK